MEWWRSRSERTVVLRRPSARVLVLGPTQSVRIVDAARASGSSTAVVKRRSGGGAVLVGPPGDPLWIDLWVPRGDPLFEEDVIRAAFWVGDWWAGALRHLGLPAPEVHRDRSRTTPWSRLACFAGTGPGEVSLDGRKIVGLAQWRARQGALFQTCAYRRWEPASLVELLALPEADRARMRADLAESAVGLDELGLPESGDLGATLVEALPPGPPWRRPPV